MNVPAHGRETHSLPSVTVGEAELTLVPDGEPFALSAEEAYGVPASAGWGRYTPPDREGLIRVMSYSLLVKARGGVALVDTGGANCAESSGRRSGYLEQLAALGVGREEVATVVITHAHLDHIGYNTVQDAGSFAPTFPKAAYFVQRSEAEDFRAADPAGWDRYFRPVEEAGKLHLVTGDEEAAPGRNVGLRPGRTNAPGITCLATPGHTRGHQSVLIDCGGGGGAIYLGDLAVTKLHLENPDWSCTWAQSPEAERKSKRKIIDLALRTDALLVFGHDPNVSWGRLVRKGGGVEVVPWDARAGRVLA